MLRMSVPGNPGEDYPIYAEVPETAFLCDGQVCCLMPEVKVCAPELSATRQRTNNLLLYGSVTMIVFSILDISTRWTGDTTRTLRPSAKRSTSAPPMATEGSPSTASSAPTAPCSTRPTLFASTGSTWTAPRQSPSTASTIRLECRRALEVSMARHPHRQEVTQHLRQQQLQLPATQQLPRTIPLRLQRTTLPQRHQHRRAMRRRLTMVMELPSRTHYQGTEERRGEEGEKREQAVEVGEAELGSSSRLKQEGRARLNSLSEAEV